MRSRYVLDNLILIDARRVLVVLSIDHQRYGVNRTFVGGEGDPSRVIGAGKHLSPPHQQELRALLTLSEAECDTAGRASSIKGQHQSGPLRGAAPKSHPQTESSMPSAERSTTSFSVGKGRVPHERPVPEQPYRSVRWPGGKC